MAAELAKSCVGVPPANWQETTTFVQQFRR